MSKKIQNRKRVSFEFATEPRAEVFVAGSFNGWNPTKRRLTEKFGSGVYRAALVLARGRYEYKFIVNGKWFTDPTSPELAPDGYGSNNAVVNVV